jgi:hypothetical protein
MKKKYPLFFMQDAGSVDPESIAAKVRERLAAKKKASESEVIIEKKESVKNESVVDLTQKVEKPIVSKPAVNKSSNKKTIANVEIPKKITTAGPTIPEKNIGKPLFGFVDLKREYGYDPLSKDGIEKAIEISEQYPDTRFICNAQGCSQIATDAAIAYGKDVWKSHAWDLGNKNPVGYQNPKYKTLISTIKGPLPDPVNFTELSEFVKHSGNLIGLNRRNNKKFLDGNDSFDYADEEQYPKSRKYEHVGYILENGKILHGTGEAGVGFYIIDDTKDNTLKLPGYERYDPVEIIQTPLKKQKNSNVSAIKEEPGIIDSFLSLFKKNGGGVSMKNNIVKKQIGGPYALNETQPSVYTKDYSDLLTEMLNLGFTKDEIDNEWFSVFDNQRNYHDPFNPFIAAKTREDYVDSKEEYGFKPTLKISDLQTPKKNIVSSVQTKASPASNNSNGYGTFRPVTPFANTIPIDRNTTPVQQTPRINTPRSGYDPFRTPQAQTFRTADESQNTPYNPDYIPVPKQQPQMSDSFTGPTVPDWAQNIGSNSGVEDEQPGLFGSVVNEIQNNPADAALLGASFLNKMFTPPVDVNKPLRDFRTQGQAMSRGDWTTNRGVLQPNKMGYFDKFALGTGSMKDGGAMVGEAMMSDEEIFEFLANGGELEILE